MKNELSADQIKSYHEKGSIVIDEFLTQDELAVWRDAVDEAVARRGSEKLPFGRWKSEKRDYYDRVFVQRLNLWQDSEAVRELILDPRIGKMCCELEGVDGIRVWHDQALIKEPWGNPTAWHLDNPYWSFTSRHAISIWVALDDATQQNGCMYLIPGSHLSGDHDRQAGIDENVGGLFELYPEWADIDPICAAMTAGSCSFHNGLTAHGAGANMTPGYRRAMTCGYMPDGCTYNGAPNILPESYTDSIEIGDALESEEHNPLVWPKEMATAI